MTDHAALLALLSVTQPQSPVSELIRFNQLVHIPQFKEAAPVANPLSTAALSASLPPRFVDTYSFELPPLSETELVLGAEYSAPADFDWEY